MIGVMLGKLEMVYSFVQENSNQLTVDECIEFFEMHEKGKPGAENEAFYASSLMTQREFRERSIITFLTSCNLKSIHMIN